MISLFTSIINWYKTLKNIKDNNKIFVKVSIHFLSLKNYEYSKRLIWKRYDWISFRWYVSLKSVDDSDCSPPTMNSNKSISFRSLKLKAREKLMSVIMIRFIVAPNNKWMSWPIERNHSLNLRLGGIPPIVDV